MGYNCHTSDYGWPNNIDVDMIESTWSYWLSLAKKQKKTKES